MPVDDDATSRLEAWGVPQVLPLLKLRGEQVIATWLWSAALKNLTVHLVDFSAVGGVDTDAVLPFNDLQVAWLFAKSTISQIESLFFGDRQRRLCRTSGGMSGNSVQSSHPTLFHAPPGAPVYLLLKHTPLQRRGHLRSRRTESWASTGGRPVIMRPRTRRLQSSQRRNTGASAS